MRPNLRLRRETLVALESDELAQVPGGIPWTPWCHVTIDPVGWIRQQLTETETCDTKSC